MTDFIDPFADDADLLEENNQDTATLFNNTTILDDEELEKDIGDISWLREVLNNLFTLQTEEFEELSKTIELEALTRCVISLIGEEEYTKALKTAKHRQKAIFWKGKLDVAKRLESLIEKYGDAAEPSMAVNSSMVAIKTFAAIVRDSLDHHVNMYKTISGKNDVDETETVSSAAFARWRQLQKYLVRKFNHNVDHTERSFNKDFILNDTINPES